MSEKTLTSTERQVVTLLTEGLTNNEIALRMNISRHTVKSHLDNIYQKYDLHSRIELAIRFYTGKL